MKRLVGEFTCKELLIRNTNNSYSPKQTWKEIIKKDWQKLQEKARRSGGKVWNGKLYRLSKVVKKGKKYILYIGNLDFKTHHATPLLKNYLKETEFSKRPNGIYISSYIQTSDSKLIFGLKGERATSKYSINLLGGILNQDEMEINTASDLFGYFYKEFKEETDIEKRFIKDTEGLGIFIADDLKIMVLLKVTLSIPSYQFNKKAKTSMEHKKFILLGKDELRKLVSKENGVNPNIQETLPFF